MVSRESQRLERSARKVAFGRPQRVGIRAAVRDLTLTALRSRMLTLPHLASVADAIAHGIDPEAAGVKGGGSSKVRATEGLQDALTHALVAIDLALREYLAVGGRLSHAEADQWRAALDALGEARGVAIAEPLVQVRKSLRAVEAGEAVEGTYVLGLLASGALLGLLHR